MLAFCKESGEKPSVSIEVQKPTSPFLVVRTHVNYIGSARHDSCIVIKQ